MHSGTLRTVLEMGVFDALPMDGSSSSATILAENLGVEKELLGKYLHSPSRYIRQLSLGKFDSCEYSRSPDHSRR